MRNKIAEKMLEKKDMIFEIFEFSQKRIREVGEENVYDFSLGNPSVPSPDSVSETIHLLLDELKPLELHGYSPGKGIADMKNAVAMHLNQKMGAHYGPEHIFPTLGAAGALAHALRTAANPGEEIVTFAPCFSEYEPYTAGAGLKLTIVPADTEHFQIDFEAFDAVMNPNVAVVLVNSPNNPSGVVYSTETIMTLARKMREKETEYGHPIYLISDEPYRDIIFKGTDSPYIANYYDNTLTCYSYSKSLSLPGERIGYLAVSPECEDGEMIMAMCSQVSRMIGMNGAPSLMQRLIGRIEGQTADLSVYETNKNLLYDALTSYGYSCVEPGGTFYMFPRSPIPDSMKFCHDAMKEDLMLVPGDIFGCPGHFRIAYCVPTQKVKKALPVFRKMIECCQE